MLLMAQGMKEFANGFQQQFKIDSSIMTQISNQQDLNLAKTQAEVDSLQKFTGTVVTGFFTRVFMLLFALAIFVFMLMFIRFFPNKIYL